MELEAILGTGWMDRVEPGPRAEKMCTRCKEFKPLDAFTPRRDAKDGRYSACRVCRRSKGTVQKCEGAPGHPPHVWFRPPTKGMPQKLCPEVWSPSARQAAWVKNNPGAVALLHAIRRGAEKVGDRDLHWSTVAARDGMKCAYCGVLTVEKHEDRKLWPTLDHVIPIKPKTGPVGTHTMDNAVLACFSCNASKGNRTLDEWKR